MLTAHRRVAPSHREDTQVRANGGTQSREGVNSDNLCVVWHTHISNAFVWCRAVEPAHAGHSAARTTSGPSSTASPVPDPDLLSSAPLAPPPLPLPLPLPPPVPGAFCAGSTSLTSRLSDADPGDEHTRQRRSAPHTEAAAAMDTRGGTHSLVPSLLASWCAYVQQQHATAC